MQEMTLDTLFAQGQIRLAEISVFNWGSFHNLHTARIDPEGTLITGDNGAGKSTFIDGLMALLQPASKASFNVAAAQGDRSDRSLVTYMRGSYGSEHDGSTTKVKSKREKAVTTALRALYIAEDGSQITLIGLFWLGQGKNSLSDVNRLYMIASRNVLLTEVLEIFADGNTRQLKQHFNPKTDQRIHYFESDFKSYQDMYRKYLFMDNQNAPALLSRALGLKKIDDLTKLIRELVLEPSNLRETAQTAVNEFADLEANYKHLVDTREQVEHLERLPQCAEQIAELTQRLAQLHLEKQSIAAYFGELFAALWTEKLQQLEQELLQLKQQFQQIEQLEQDAETRQERRHEEYLQLGGGLIEKLQSDLVHIQENLQRVTRASSSYQKDAQNLNLKIELQEISLKNNQKLVLEQLKDIEQDSQASFEQYSNVNQQAKILKNKITELEDEIQEIEKCPESNISDTNLLLMRKELIQDLQFEEHELMFIGELLDVKDSEKAWQGAIERALGGLKTTLLVPQDRYSLVTKWVNARNNKTHVRLQVVNLKQVEHVHFKNNGFLGKLIWREHVYRDWLKQYLQRFDLQCVADTQTLDKTPFSITQQGLIHKEYGRFEKKDQHHINARKEWCLGFSNKSRLALLQHEKIQLEQEKIQADRLVQAALLNAKQINDRQNKLNNFLEYKWEEINLPYWQQRQQQTQQDLQRLQQADSDAEQARQRWEDAKNELKQIRLQKGESQKIRGQLEQQHRDTQLKQQKAQQAAEQGISDDARQLLKQRIGEVKQLDDALQGKFEKELDELVGQANDQKAKASNTAIGIIGAFRGKDKWAHIPLQREWATGLAALEDYVAYLQELQQEGLPNLVEQFQQRLHKHTAQSLSVIQDKLNANREEIIDRIDMINQVLQRTEFKLGSYLRLGYKKEKYPHVHDFEQRLKQVLSGVNSEEYERRFKHLAELMAILDRASSSATANNQESLRLLDPRYQMSFHAEEVDAQTSEIRDVLESSSGKSGGEKESFAGTIVAASLAYVLTPDGYDYPIYSTVFLDEAFSNTAEAVSRRVLKVFKALKIHVNLITPYKNLNLARESARSLLIAERDIDQHESHLCEVTWQEIDERMQQRKQTIAIEAQQLGIELHG